MLNYGILEALPNPRGLYLFEVLVGETSGDTGGRDLSGSYSSYVSLPTTASKSFKFFFALYSIYSYSDSSSSISTIFILFQSLRGLAPFEYELSSHLGLANNRLD